jgi:hypothetical protein
LHFDLEEVVLNLRDPRRHVAGFDFDASHAVWDYMQANRYQYASIVLMSTLYLRNVPPDLDAALTADARANGVSKNRRAIEALQRGLGLDQIKRSELVAQIRGSRPSVEADVAKLIREERPGQDI